MVIEVADLREHAETDLGDDALERLLQDAYDFCDERVGPLGEQTIVLDGRERWLILPRAVADADFVTISERFGDQTTELVLDTDWRWNGGRIVERLSGGSVVFWGHEYGGGDVVVTYTPKDDTDRRDRVVIDLCKLAIQYNALHSERAGDYASTAPDYARERDRIVRQLAPAMGVA